MLRAFLQNQFFDLEKHLSGNDHLIEMKTIVLIFSMIVSFSSSVFCRTVEERTLASLVHAIRLYNSQKKETPTSWKVMEQFGSETTLKSAREILDIENRYFFPNIENAFASRHQSKRRIILMAKNSGEEGDIRNYESFSSFKSNKGRFVIFKNTVSGEIESGKITEEELFTTFQR
jgi:hypothetical protein